MTIEAPLGAEIPRFSVHALPARFDYRVDLFRAVWGPVALVKTACPARQSVRHGKPKPPRRRVFLAETDRGGQNGDCRDRVPVPWILLLISPPSGPSASPRSPQRNGPSSSGDIRVCYWQHARYPDESENRHNERRGGSKAHDVRHRVVRREADGPISGRPFPLS